MDDLPPNEPAPIPATITPEAQERWYSLPADRQLQIILTRTELDYLFLSIRECIVALSHLSETVKALSNGDTPNGQKAYDEAQTHQQNAISQIDRLILHAMTTAQPV